jgi:hypothetical protein
MFVTTSARSILFDGIPIYCNVTDFSSKAVCSEIKRRKDEFQQLDENIYGFSFFGMVSICFGIAMHVQPMYGQESFMRSTPFVEL